MVIEHDKFFAIHEVYYNDKGDIAAISEDPIAPARLSLPDVVHRYKSFTTSEYRIGVEQLNWIPFPGKLWQRNYYKHIIRDDMELHKVREYIRYNPLNWDEDEENPQRKGLHEI